MKIVPEAINFLGAAVTSGDVFTEIKKAVSNIDDADIPNKEKHSTVFQYIKAIGYPIGKLALNFGIKLAVMWLREKAT
jgi:hypothetical protein